MANGYDDEPLGAYGMAPNVPVNEWFPVNTATGEWQLPGSSPTLARSAGLPDATAPPVWGGAPDQAPLALGQVAGTLAPPLAPQPRLQRVARLADQGLLPGQPSTLQTIARAIGMASPTGRAILQGFDQQQQQQLQNRLALRRQQLLEEQDARQATQTSLDTFRKISEMPNKTMRNLMFDRYVADMQARGQQVPADVVTAFKQSSLDEGKQMAQMLTPMFEAAGIDPTTAAQILQEGGDPKRLMEMIDLGLKAKKQKADEAEEARLTQQRQTLFSASTGAAAPPAAPTPPVTTTTVPPAGQGTVPPALDTAVTEATKLYPQVRPDLVHGIIRHESNYDVGAVSPKGAVGPMQLMPDTARDMGVDPKDPTQNVRGGTRFFAQLLTRYGGNEALALAAYNWGPGNVDKVNGDLTKMPAETQAYVKNVLASAAPGGQRGPAGTQGQVAGPGAPAADQAQLTKLTQQISAMDQFIAANVGSGRERTKGMVNEVQQERSRLIQEREKLTEPQRAYERERLQQPLALERVREGKALTPISTETAKSLAANKSIYTSIGKIEKVMTEGTDLPQNFVDLVAQDAPEIQAMLQQDPSKLTGILQQFETKWGAASKNDPRVNRFLSALANMRDLILRERSGGSVTGNELERGIGAFMGSLPNINQAFSLFAQNLANIKGTVTDQLVTLGGTVKPLSGGTAVYNSLPKDVRDLIDRYERGEEAPKATMSTPAPQGRPKVTGPIRQVPP